MNATKEIKILENNLNMFIEEINRIYKRQDLDYQYSYTYRNIPNPKNKELKKDEKQLPSVQSELVVSCTTLVDVEVEKETEIGEGDFKRIKKVKVKEKQRKPRIIYRSTYNTNNKEYTKKDVYRVALQELLMQSLNTFLSTNTVIAFKELQNNKKKSNIFTGG